LSGGDVLPISTIQKIHATTTTKVYNLYGTSETGVCTIATHEDLIQYPATIGSKITGVQCKIVNTNGNEISEGIGELWVCCKWVSDARSQNYVATGDLVSCNAAGFYFYKGRKDDLIVVGGENMYPIELETIIYKYPNIEWVKVSPFLDENQNTRVKASLVLKNGMPFLESEFIHWLSTQTPAYSIPKLIEIVQEVDTIKLM
jgi:acyl-CoA synthetase (AMP-forming)/AMP-acid ligase II